MLVIPRISLCWGVLLCMLHPCRALVVPRSLQSGSSRVHPHQQDLQKIHWRDPCPTRARPTTARTTTLGLFFDNGDKDDDNTKSVMESQFFNVFDEDDETLTDLRYAPTKKGRDASFNPQLEAKKTIFFEDLLRFSPFVIPILAFTLYDAIAVNFAKILDLMANVNWVAVDGGAYQAKIIAPAINGIVVPAISILFATLIGTTISTLRQRQLDIRTAINMEAGQLRILQSMVNSFPPTVNPNQCRFYLIQYTSRLIAESQPTVDVDSLDFALDSELNGLLMEFNRISNYATQHVPGPIMGECYSACSQLYGERARRITALRSLFPPLHFIIVSTLAISICVAFLLESNQVLLVFLNAIQLRILWTMLVGTFSALAIVCYDLGNPFRGSYQISKSVSQLYTIRLALRASLGGGDDTKASRTTSPATRMNGT
jgi:Protein of unknown function (DUF4239)